MSYVRSAEVIEFHLDRLLDEVYEQYKHLYPVTDNFFEDREPNEDEISTKIDVVEPPKNSSLQWID